MFRIHQAPTTAQSIFSNTSIMCRFFKCVGASRSYVAISLCAPARIQLAIIYWNVCELDCYERRYSSVCISTEPSSRGQNISYSCSLIV